MIWFSVSDPLVLENLPCGYAALHSLLEGKIQRIVLARPAVEAGEALGFSPVVDLEEKLLPYLRPLYDAMDEVLGPVDARKLIETGVVEIAPLAYMRGRTLSKCFAHTR